MPCLLLAFRGHSEGPRRHPSSRAVAVSMVGWRGDHASSCPAGSGLGVVEGGRPLCSLPEADDSSVFVVGTVLYRNLGSFLALQREWASRAQIGAGEAQGLVEVGAGEAGV